MFSTVCIDIWNKMNEGYMSGNHKIVSEQSNFGSDVKQLWEGGENCLCAESQFWVWFDNPFDGAMWMFEY